MLRSPAIIYNYFAMVSMRFSTVCTNVIYYNTFILISVAHDESDMVIPSKMTYNIIRKQTNIMEALKVIWKNILLGKICLLTYIKIFD